MGSVTSFLKFNTRYNGVLFKYITTIYTGSVSGSFVELNVLNMRERHNTTQHNTAHHKEGRKPIRNIQ